MRETRADTAEAIVLALLLHAVPLLLLLLASLWRAPDGGTAGEPVVADVVDLGALSASTRAALRRAPDRPQPPPEPAEPEPQPEDALPEPLEETPPEQQLQPQEQLPDPDTVDRQEVVPDVAAELAQREQEARRRQGQIDLTDERQRQQQAEQRQTEMQRQREQQLADIRRQQAENRRQIELAEEKQRQIEDALRARAEREARNAAANPPPGNRGASDNAALAEAYRQALMQAIRSNWTQPDNVSPAQVCKIVIRQIPGGTVVDAQVDPSCPYDELGRRSVEAAVLKAQPLPHRGFEAVFNRTLILNFRAEDR